jgi:hypothetical protein
MNLSIPYNNGRKGQRDDYPVLLLKMASLLLLHDDRLWSRQVPHACHVMLSIVRATARSASSVSRLSSVSSNRRSASSARSSPSGDTNIGFP